MNGHTTPMKGSGKKYGRELDEVVSKKKWSTLFIVRKIFKIIMRFYLKVA